MRFLLLLLLVTTFSFSLNGQGYQIIHGKLVDKDTNEPIPYANIGIPHRGIGTTSSSDGNFLFKIPDYYAGSNLMVSVIGYERFTMPLREVKSPATIKLNPTAYQLSEVQIIDESAVENIVRKAISRIPTNYPSKANSATAFYRESRTDESDEYVYLAEGVLNVYKTSYENQKEGFVSLIQGRKINMENPLDTIVRGGFSSGHMAAHRFDFVKNREDFIDEEYFPAYRYWVENMTSFNGREVYIIGFDIDPDAPALKNRNAKSKSLFHKLLNFTKSYKLEARMRGKMYIDKNSYAFIRAEFEITPYGLKKYDDYPLYSGVWTFNKYIVNYQNVDGKWYFSDAVREGGRKSGGIYSNEIKITEIETGRAEKIPYLERLERGEEFVDMTGTYDEDFWKSYNIVPMSDKLTESMQQYKSAQESEKIFAPERMSKIIQLRDSLEIAKRIEKAEQKALENEEEFDMRDISIGEPGIQRQRPKRFSSSTMFGIGSHLLSTPQRQLAVSYFEKEGKEPLLSVDNTINSREFEIIGAADLNFVINERWFLRFGGALDFGRSIYKESASGLGVQFNLSRQRPVFLKLSAQHSRMRYGRNLGSAENLQDRILIGSKNFNTDFVRIAYGSRLRSLKLTGEMSIELNRNKEIYLRGSYYLPYSQRQYVFFKENSWIFKKRERLELPTDRISVTSDDLQFSNSLLMGHNIQLTIGYLFK
ncbi:carboxypeptidase-like regulatory domain-containing protein [Portibacter marinus]|uniref:carboxypeptidase-like regulatory domain-containing protein n=1 Tax=Portibacter marinus TaxID=2898660 RepID=UPI001F354D06|nr:carboxypeptidase-like regulatory domain-containing protein [Portibacter marinus]